MPDIELADALDDSLTPKVSPTATLVREGNDLTNQIIEANDTNQLNDLSNLFAMNQRKKSLARQNRLSNLLEIIDDEVIMRFSSYPESFDNDQLVRYMESTQRAVNGIEQSLNQAPTIQINNTTNEINVGTSGLNRESRAKVIDAVNKLMNSLQNDNADSIIDIEPNKEGN